MEVGLNGTPSYEGSSVRSYTLPDEFIFESPIQRLFAAIVTCLISIIGISGNGLVIVAVMFSKKLQNKTNVFVVNLASADILTCSVLPFQAAFLVSETLPLPASVCKAVSILMWLGLGSVVMNLAFIAFTRYTIITKSGRFNERFVTNYFLFFLACGAWLVPLLFILAPPALGVGALGYSHRYKLCTAVSSHAFSDVYILISLSFEFLCLFVILTCYVNIYRFLRKSNFNLIQSSNCFTISDALDSERGPKTVNKVAVLRRQVIVTKKLFIIVCTYIICVMPFGLICGIPAPTYPLIPWAYLLLFLNPCLNPIIYGLQHPQFKEVFGLIVTCSFSSIPEPSRLLSSLNNIAT